MAALNWRAPARQAILSFFSGRDCIVTSGAIWILGEDWVWNFFPHQDLGWGFLGILGDIGD